MVCEIKFLKMRPDPRWWWFAIDECQGRWCTLHIVGAVEVLHALTYYSRVGLFFLRWVFDAAVPAWIGVWNKEEVDDDEEQEEDEAEADAEDDDDDDDEEEEEEEEEEFSSSNSWCRS